jgi:rSAM/selenodomain-associated transferase 1
VRRHLIVYAKRPLPGYAKTRLGADIGDERAAGIYARLLYAYLLDLLRADPAGISVDTIELSVATLADVSFFSDAFPELLVCRQVSGDLGQRMAASFERAFAAGAEAVVLTGSDIPGLNTQIVRAAFDALDASPVVIGPASDGGYYLIGMRAPRAALFEGIEWSSERVWAQTEVLARAHGLVVAHLPELHDVDTVEDLVRWRQETLCSDGGGQEPPEPAKELEVRGQGETQDSTAVSLRTDNPTKRTS